MKLGLVVQRYGADIAGGSEAHCREIALRLADRHTVTVLTTCARDYVTWANHYPPGTSTDGPVRVRRFPVRHRRRLKLFADLSDEVFDGGASPARQEAWFRENGPDVPELLDHLVAAAREYDLVLFWTFRYAPSYFGVPLLPGRAILVPTAEEDPAIALEVLEDFFKKPSGFIFLTPEEEVLVSARAGAPLTPSVVIGTGLEPVTASAPIEALREIDVEPPYFLYLGRVDKNKGCHTLLEYYASYAEGTDAPPLVLAGPAKIAVPVHPKIRALGYVSNALRDALLAHAQALIVPSRYESLSIVLLEAWNHAVPAVVNAECRVLDGQVRRANGGLSYRSEADFIVALEYLRSHPEARMQFGRQGRAYVDAEYRWPTVLARVESLLASVSSQSDREAREGR